MWAAYCCWEASLTLWEKQGRRENIKLLWYWYKKRSKQISEGLQSRNWGEIAWSLCDKPVFNWESVLLFSSESICLGEWNMSGSGHSIMTSHPGGHSELKGRLFGNQSGEQRHWNHKSTPLFPFSFHWDMWDVQSASHRDPWLWLHLVGKWLLTQSLAYLHWE